MFAFNAGCAVQLPQVICLMDFSNPIDYEINTHGALSKTNCIRETLGNCSVTVRWQCCHPYKTSKTVHVHAKQHRLR